MLISFWLNRKKEEAIKHLSSDMRILCIFHKSNCVLQTLKIKHFIIHAGHFYSCNNCLIYYLCIICISIKHVFLCYVYVRTNARFRTLKFALKQKVEKVRNFHFFLIAEILDSVFVQWLKHGKKITEILYFLWSVLSVFLV